MKTYMKTAVSALALALVAGAAYATPVTPVQPTTTSLNSTVTQEGSNQTATVVQSATTGSSTVNQSGAKNIADVNQKAGSEGASSVVFQSGSLQTGRTGRLRNNEAYVTQVTDATSYVNQRGSEGKVTINQNGGSVGATSVVIQDVTWVSQQSTIEVTQSGKNAISNIGSKGTNESSAADDVAGQSGSDNFIKLIQSAEDADSTITQSDTNNYISVNQSGFSAKSEIIQGGTNNDLFLTQSGSDNYSYISQSGNDGRVDVYQAANNAWSSVTQSGTLNVATVTQGVRP